jgi:transcriptional regulator with XRE-family HTH domain
MPAGRTPKQHNDRMREIRTALGLTQVEMAEKLGVRSDTVSRYERGDRHVPEPTLRLAESLLSGKPRRRPARETGAPEK